VDHGRWAWRYSGCRIKQRYAGRHLIENAFCRLKDFRRIHTRYDKLAANFASAVALAAIVAFWCRGRRSLSVGFRARLI